ncbi:hypothetical protein C3513_26180 [Salmonella enterica]|nr:hypothetical protein [Salmonella enterica]
MALSTNRPGLKERAASSNKHAPGPSRLKVRVKTAMDRTSKAIGSIFMDRLPAEAVTPRPSSIQRYNPRMTINKGG